VNRDTALRWGGWTAAQLLFAALVALALTWRWPVPEGTTVVVRAHVEGHEVA
jgi:hypothetical protein